MKTAHSLLLLSLLGALACPATRPAQAQGLYFSPLSPFEVAPGDFTFAGTVTNDTGAALRSTDLFFDFTAFDPSSLYVNQLLGVTDFTIADGTTCAVTDLFDASLSAGVAAQDYPVTVQLQDVNGDVTDAVTVTVRATAAVPEPATPVLLSAGCVCMLPLALRSRRQ